MDQDEKYVKINWVQTEGEAEQVPEKKTGSAPTCDIQQTGIPLQQSDQVVVGGQAEPMPTTNNNVPMTGMNNGYIWLSGSPYITSAMQLIQCYPRESWSLINKEYDQYNRERTLDCKHNIKMREDAQLRENKARAKLEDMYKAENVFVDSSGFLHLEVTTNKSMKFNTIKLFDKPNIMLTQYISMGCGNVLFERIEWDGGFIVLRPKYCSGKGLLCALEKAGNALLVGRDRKKEIASIIYAYLIRHKTEVHVPDRYGWNRLEDGSWHFFTDEELSKILKKGGINIEEYRNFDFD